ncbi:MAG: hypothetical protein M1318_05670 [Firmicutes bacterium]|nr:hypothetical protein [Bacillota bacterium]
MTKETSRHATVEIANAPVGESSAALGETLAEVLDGKEIAEQTVALVPKRLSRVVNSVTVSEW